MGKRVMRTVGDVFDETALSLFEKEALVIEDQRLTFADLYNYADRLARALLSLGIKKGEKAAIWVANKPEWAWIEMACAKIGMPVIPVNTRYKVDEVRYILNQSDSSTLFFMDSFLKIDYVPMINELCPEILSAGAGELNVRSLPYLKNVICLSEERYPGVHRISDLLDLGGGMEDTSLKLRQAEVSPDDLFIIPYTSGTTGFPKGVMTTHAQYLTFIKHASDSLEIGQEDCNFIPSPFYHNLGNMFGLVMMAYTGCSMVTSPAFDPGQALRLIERERCTFFPGSPTMYSMLMDHPDFPQRDISSLKKGMIGAAASPVELIKKIVEQMGMTGLRAGYGLTECTGGSTMTKPGDPFEKIAKTVGVSLSDEIKVKIVDPETYAELPSGQVGELCVHGFLVMKGYYKKPEETNKVIDEDGWLHTGDLAEMDEDGYIVIKGRLKEMFINGGVNVYPAEIENFLHKHPKVKVAQVIGCPDERLGEVGMAFIQLNEGEIATEEEIITFCKNKIANYKVPRYVRFVHELPTTATGKIQKFRLQETIGNKHIT